MASINEAQVYSASVARIILGGDVVGHAQGITWNVDDGVTPVGAVGSYTMLEHQPTQQRVNGSIQRWRTRSTNVKAFKGRSPDDVLRAGVVDLEIYDEVTKKPIKIIEGITFGGSSGGVSTGQLLTENVPFVAIRVRE